MQYVKDDFTLGAISFRAVQYEGKQTVEHLIKSVKGEGGLIQQWDLERFKRVYTTDSYSANVKAFEDELWAPCFAHIIHNTVKAGLTKTDEIRKLHQKVASIVQFLHKSPETLALLKDATYWLVCPDLTVTSDCPTR